MGLCEKHTRFFKDTEECPQCFIEGAINTKANAANETDKLYTQAYISFINHQKDNYRRKHGTKYFICCTCPAKVSVTTRGIYGIHWGHWYPKAIYWPYSLNPMNGGLQCYECNINGNGKPIEMQAYLEAAYGLNKISNLKDDMEMWLDQVKQGIESPTITLSWIKSFKIK